MEARSQRLETLKARIKDDLRSFKDVMTLLLDLSEKLPEMEQTKQVLARWKGLKWDALRFVCENLAAYPPPTSPESLWRNPNIMTKAVTKEKMAKILFHWVSVHVCCNIDTHPYHFREQRKSTIRMPLYGLISSLSHHLTLRRHGQDLPLQ